VWTSTKHGNKRLDQAYTESSRKGPIYLFFSVNGSGCFCGVALMTSNVDYDKTFGAWSQSKWSGQFGVKWIYIKNIPNKRLRHIRLVNNNNKSVTNSRDTQEVYLEPGKQVLKVFHTFEHNFSILDDFEHFDRLEDAKKKETDSTSEPTDGETTTNTNTSSLEQKSRSKVPSSGTSSRPKTFSEAFDTRGKDGGQTTYVPTSSSSRGKGQGQGQGQGRTTFAVKAKPMSSIQ